jgi:peptidoglycan/LPS O-acetylase OafA/YrhL
VSPPATTPDASPALAPPPGNPRFPHFDGLRGIAILMVVGFHAAALGDGLGHAVPLTGQISSSFAGDLGRELYSGVSLFFAISGFLLYRPYAHARATGRRPPTVREFARRRALRILPAYWVALTLLGLAGEGGGALGADWWRYYGFLQVYDPDTLAGGIQVAWSLCVEVVFYLLLPIYAVCVAAIARRAGTLAAETAGLVLLVGGCLLFRAGLRSLEISPYLIRTFPAQATFFAIGIGLAAASVAVAHRERAPWIVERLVRHSWLAWGGAALAFAVAARAFRVENLVISQFTWFAFYANHVLIACAILLLMAPLSFHLRPAGLASAVTAWKGLVWLGLVSYGLFLWHLPLLRKVLVSVLSDAPQPTQIAGLFAFALSVCAGIAAVSYRFVELPFLRRKERTGV